MGFINFNYFNYLYIYLLLCGGGGGTTPYFLFIILFLCNGICSIKITPYRNRAEKSSDWLSTVGRSIEDGDATYV